jgi:hypothetical protein
MSLPPAEGWPSARALRALHLSAAATHVVWLACAAAALPAQEVGIPVLFRRTHYLANSSSVLVGEEQQEFEFKSLRVLLAFPAVTAAFHVAYALLPGAGGRGNPLRWLEYSVSASLLTLSALVACGITDEDAFAFAVVLSVGLQACGLGLELLPRGSGSGAREVLLFVGFLNVSVLFWQIARHAFGQVSPPGAPRSARKVSVAYGVYYFSFGVAGALRAYEVGLWRSPAWTEFTYVVLSLASKTAVFWLSFGGIKQMINFLQPARADASADWAAVQTTAAVAPGVAAAAAFAGGAWLDARVRASKPPGARAAGQWQKRFTVGSP